MQLSSYFDNNSSEFDILWKILLDRLPVVFRLNCNIPHYNTLINKLNSKINNEGIEDVQLE